MSRRAPKFDFFSLLCGLQNLLKMKTIYFVRHAKSSWDNPMLRDIERPLGGRGLKDAPFMARMLKDKGVQPDLLLSSPATRAYSTALFFADAFAVEHASVQLEPRIYEAYPEDIMVIISKLPDVLDTVLLFGHNPTFTTLANRFSPTYIDNVPTCGIFKVEASVDSWNDFHAPDTKLTAFYFPKQF